VLKTISISFVAGLMATAMTAFATPTCSDDVTDNGSLYFDGSYSCEIGDLLFSNFTYTASGTNPVAANEVTVDAVAPSGTSITGPDVGLQFNAPWDAGVNQTSDATIDFTVTELGGGSLIEDFGLAQTSGVNGTGTASVAEDGCGPAPCKATGGSIYLLTFQDNGNRVAQGETTFSPTYSSVSVEKDVSVSGGSDGFATISVVQDTFSQVPEPRALSLLLGLGLVAGFFVRKKFQGANA
jgi:hypothetical protein